MWSSPRFPRLARLWSDRRGVSTVAFAGSAVALFGAVALATDAGTWYTARRGAQNAADAGATAAAMTLALSGPAQAVATARDLAARNGFAHGGPNTVTVNIPPLSGPQAGNGSAAEVIVRQQQPKGPASLIVANPPAVQGRAVATLRDSSNICVLALTGQLSLGGNTSVSTPSCILASNMRTGASITISGNSLDLEAFSLSAVGSCQNCDSARVRLTEPYGEWQAPAQNPFARLDTKVLPTPSGNSCNNNANGNGNLGPFEANGRRVYCGDIRVNGGQTLNLSPGTYYIWNGSFIVAGQGTVTCTGCTGGQGVAIVMTGTPSGIGGISINANANVTLRAARIAQDPDYNGVLFYRDIRATTNNVNNPAITINGGAGLSLRGGMYFPSTHIRFNGTAQTSACSVIVAASLEFTGNAGVTQCAEVGTTVPRTRLLVMSE